LDNAILSLNICRLLRGRGIEIRKPMLTDILGIIDIYREVTITPENIDEKINIASPHSWSKQGGIFHVLTQEELTDIILNTDDYVSFVAVEKNTQTIKGFVFTKISLPYPDSKTLRLVESFSNVQDILHHFCAKKSAYHMDILVSLSERGTGIARVLLYIHLQHLVKINIDSLFFDIYTIHSVTGKNTQELCAHNIPSERFHSFCGAQKIGTSEKKIPVSEYIFAIEVNVFFLKTQAAIFVLEDFFASIFSEENEEGELQGS
jgi:hypothetical protein